MSGPDVYKRPLPQGLQLLEELRAVGTVDDAVVEGAGDCHLVDRLEGAAVPHRLYPDAAHSQDAALRRVDDGDELIHVIHAQVGDGDAAAAHVRRGQLALPGLFDPVSYTHLAFMKMRALTADLASSENRVSSYVVFLKSSFNVICRSS